MINVMMNSDFLRLCNAVIPGNLMVNHNICNGVSMAEHKNLSESEEMYLVTIRKACEHCTDTPLPIPDLAKALGVQPVSVNQMVNKMTENGLVKYIPYKGVELTVEGRIISTKILRHRRLWEVFLVKFLQMGLEEADTFACQLEHITSVEIANRLSTFLNNPTTCFHGRPIPSANAGQVSLFEGFPVSDLQIGQAGSVLRTDMDPATIKFLANDGIRLGVEVRLLAVGSNGDVVLATQTGSVHISSEIASGLLVSQPKPGHDPEQQKEQSMAVPLSNLKVGEKGIIHKMNFKGAIRQRLMAMGLVMGEIIQVKRVAPLGDPIDFVIKGYDLSLRKAEANEILVNPM